MSAPTTTETRVFAYVEYLTGDPEYDDTTDGCLIDTFESTDTAVATIDSHRVLGAVRYEVRDVEGETTAEWTHRTGWTFPEIEEG